MTTRAAAAARTTERILDAAAAVFAQTPMSQIVLSEVADRAEVSVQTVLRKFGDKDALFAAVAEHVGRDVQAHRGEATPDDLPGAVANLVEHYERHGDTVVKLLGEEAGVPSLREVADVGRAYHRDWCARVFAGALAPLQGRDRERRLAQLVAVCDIHTWHLLRRQEGLSRAQTEVALLETLEPLVGGS